MAQAAVAALEARPAQALSALEVQVEAVVPSASWYLRGRKCLQRIPQAWFLWVLVQAVLPERLLRTQALLMVIPAGRAETLRLARLPQRSVAVAVVVAQVLQQRALAVAEAVSAQRVQALVRLVLTVPVAEELEQQALA